MTIFHFKKENKISSLTDALKTRSLLRELSEFVEEIMSNEDTVSVEKLVRLAHAHFGEDGWIRDALVREGLNSLIPGIAQEVRHELRTKARVATDDEQIRRERIQSVFEHVGSGFSKSLLTMTRPEHLFAAQERETQAAGHLRWAGFHRAIAALHKDNTTPTGDLPPAEIAKAWQEHIERND